jgi:hypothetical protein
LEKHDVSEVKEEGIKYEGALGDEAAIRQPAADGYYHGPAENRKCLPTAGNWDIDRGKCARLLTNLGRCGPAVDGHSPGVATGEV